MAQKSSRYDAVKENAGCEGVQTMIKRVTYHHYWFIKLKNPHYLYSFGFCVHSGIPVYTLLLGCTQWKKNVHSGKKMYTAKFPSAPMYTSKSGFSPIVRSRQMCIIRVGESDRFFYTNGGEAPPEGAGARSTSSSLDVSWLIYFQGAYGGCQRKKSSELDVLFGLLLLSLARSSECVGLFAGCSERTTARRYVPWDTGGSCCYLMAHISRAYTLIPAQSCLPRATFTAPCWLAAAL